MATALDFIEFVCERIADVGSVRHKKMFGEYMVYVNDKPILLVCDNTVYVKMLPQLSEIMSQSERGVPYSGAKEHYVLDIENEYLAREAVRILESVTPFPKKRVKKQ